MQYSKNVMIGADPEFFVRKDGEFVSAHLTGITGTKRRPQRLSNGGYIQVDGLALEVNVPPSDSARGFVQNLVETMKAARALVPDEFEFAFTSSATFPDWKKVPTKYKELGCEPDYSAVTGEEKTPPEGSGDKNYRCAGGHLHFGYTEKADIHDRKFLIDCCHIVQRLEAQSTSIATDPDRERRQLYGAPHSFRPKPYGLEWRTPSNFWLTWSIYEIESFISFLKQTVESLFAHSSVSETGKYTGITNRWRSVRPTNWKTIANPNILGAEKIPIEETELINLIRKGKAA